MAFELNISKNTIPIGSLPTDQHDKWKWFTVDSLLETSAVHEYTKAFFKKTDRINEKQYSIVASRRQSYDAMLWQTPVLSLTAQAFLLTIALGADTCPPARFLAALLSLFTALGSIQLLAKHRYGERQDSEFLTKFEKLHRKNGFELIHGRYRGLLKQSWLAKISSYIVWRALLWFFAISAAIIIGVSVWLL